MNRERLEKLLDGIVPLVYKDVTSSTNDDAKALAAVGEVPVLVVAGKQTAGRGRRGNTFLSPEGGIYMSLVIPEPEDETTIEMLTSFVGVCVCEALEEVHGVRADIKWVNDIYVDGRKLAGILLERLSAHIVVGVGINGLSAPELNDHGMLTICVSECVSNPDMEILCATIVDKVIKGCCEGIDKLSTITACRERSVLLKREVCYVQGGRECHGLAIDIDSDGALLVCVDNHFRRLVSTAYDIRLLK